MADLAIAADAGATAGDRAARRRGPLPSAVFLPLLLVDAWLVMDWLAGARSLSSVLGVHAAVGSALVLLLALLRRRLGARDGVALLVLLLFGPLSGLMLLVRGASGRRQRHVATEVVAEGQAEEDPASPDAIFAAIRQGRRRARPPRHMATLTGLVAGPDRDAQNAAIATISQHYRPEMLPALTAALASEVPAVRVQAAAVFAKYRTEYGARAVALTPEGDVAARTPAQRAARAAALREVAASGFVDAATAAALSARAAALSGDAASAVSREDASARQAPPPLRLRLVKPSIEETGLRQRRHKRHSCGGIA